MQPIPPLVIVAALAAVVLGLPFGLYALLTREQRRTTREIRRAAAGQGWRYRRRHWQANPTAFRVDGQTRSGLRWILTSGNTRGYDRGWSVQLVLRFPLLGGETDLAVLPREGQGGGSRRLGSGAAGFFRGARDLASGLPAFDAAYQVLAGPRQIHQPPIEPALAERILQWPADAIAPHSVLAWRDPYGFEVQARLPAPPNWATVSYFIALADDLITRVPPPVKSMAPHTLVDRLIGRFLG